MVRKLADPMNNKRGGSAVSAAPAPPPPLETMPRLPIRTPPEHLRAERQKREAEQRAKEAEERQNKASPASEVIHTPGAAGVHLTAAGRLSWQAGSGEVAKNSVCFTARQMEAFHKLEQKLSEHHITVSLQRATGTARFTVNGSGLIHVGAISPFNGEHLRQARVRSIDEIGRQGNGPIGSPEYVVPIEVLDVSLPMWGDVA